MKKKCDAVVVCTNTKTSTSRRMKCSQLHQRHLKNSICYSSSSSLLPRNISYTSCQIVLLLFILISLDMLNDKNNSIYLAGFFVTADEQEHVSTLVPKGNTSSTDSGSTNNTKNTTNLLYDPNEEYCLPKRCKPFGSCQLETKRCIGPNIVRNESTQSIPTCKYRCACNLGYSGPECSIQKTKCNGPYMQSIINRYNLHGDEAEYAICLNGGTCEKVEDLPNHFSYRCNCDTSSNSATNTNTGTVGYACQFTDFTSCVVGQEISNIHYCVNGGQCLRYITSDDDYEDALPCTCPVNVYEGRHCQYKFGTAPELEREYVRTIYLQEEQREKEADAKNSQKKSNSTNNNNNNGVSGISIAFLTLLGLGFCIGAFIFAYKRGLQRHEISQITTSFGTVNGIQLDESDNTSSNNNNNNNNNGGDNDNKNDNDDGRFQIDDNDDNGQGKYTSPTTKGNNRKRGDDYDDEDGTNGKIELKEIV